MCRFGYCEEMHTSALKPEYPLLIIGLKNIYLLKLLLLNYDLQNREARKL